MDIRQARLITIALVLTGSLATVSPAQQPRRVELPAEPTCRGCMIELVKVARLGQPEDSVILDALSMAFDVTSRGEFLVPAAEGTRVVVYDRNGRFTRTFGRRGPGPGEFQLVYHIQVLPGDTVRVSDIRNKVQLFGPTFEYVRTISAMAGGPVGGAKMLNGETITQHRADLLRILAPDGSVRDSIRVTPVASAHQCSECNSRWLAPSLTPGRFWSTIANRCEIQQIDRQGRVHLILVRRPEWFTPWDSVPKPQFAGDRIPSQPTLYLIREGADGLLWTLGSVPDPQWREVPPGGVVSVAKTNGRRDTMLSMIDPRAGTVLAERRIPEVAGPVGRDLLYIRTQDQDGYVWVDILRPVLKRP